MTSRRVPLAVTAAGLLLLVGLAVWLVPWDPVPGGPLATPPADRYYSAEEIARAESYAGVTRRLAWASLAVSLLVSLVLGLTRLGPRLVDRLPRPWVVRVVLAVALVELAGRLVTLPFAVLVRRRQLDFGLSRQSWSGFAVDQLTAQALTITVTSVALVALLASARRWRTAWSAVAGVGLAALLVVGSFAYPVVVEPLFNSFEPLPDGPLRTEVLAVAEREGVRVEEVLVADASRRTTTLNAYVSGLGSTRRVVLYDNLVEDLPRDEALSVVAHELAHARYDDVLVGTVLGAAGVLVGVGLLGLALSGRTRERDPGDPRSVPRVLALVAVATLLASPVQNGISRLVETRADVAALEATGDATAFTEVQQSLARRSLSDPTPPGWSQFWFGSHPLGLRRIALAERVAGQR